MAIIDLRSDTVTRPTAAMLQAMTAAPLGDDVFGDDPTVLALEEKVADLLGKESALFVATGVMSNQIAVRLHARHGEQGIVHARSHLYGFEGGGAAALSGVSLHPVEGRLGTLDWAQLQQGLNTSNDFHHPQTRFVAIENTHNACGGTVVPLAFLEQLGAFARDQHLTLHLDGARLAHAHVASGLPWQTITAGFDTVSLCLSKGLGAPVGSVLAMPRAWQPLARRYRKLFGGGWRQAGVLAAAGVYALDHHVARMQEDHRRASQLAHAFAEMPELSVELDTVQTNLVFFDLADPSPQRRLALGALLRAQGVLVSASRQRLRAVTHLDVSDAGIDQAVAAMRQVLPQLPQAA